MDEVYVVALFEGRLYLQTGNVKPVFKQMTANPKIELCTMGKDGTSWLRVAADVVALFEGRLYLQTGNVKPVFKQMTANPKIELCTMGKDGTSWLRVAAEVVLDPRIEARRHMLDENPTLRRLYSEDDGVGEVLWLKNATANDGVGEVLWLKNATATFYSFEGEPRVVKF